MTAVATEVHQSFPFGKRNWLLAGAGLIVIVLGYVLLSIPPADGFASLTLAPLFLVTGYCILVPAALLVRNPSRTTADMADGTAGTKS